MSTLNSKIRLCKGIHIDRNYVNVTDYSEQQMLALCESQAHLVASSNTYSFIRNKGTIATDFSYSDAIQSNYIAFQNPDYNNKWFFAFIDEVIYNGEKNTEIKYTIDAWSTWYDKWETKPCFVVREHVNDDTVGANTVAEDLNVGDVVQEGQIEEASLSEFYYIGVETAWIPDDNSHSGGLQSNGISVYNKSVFGNKVILFSTNFLTSYLNLAYYLIRTNSEGHIADVKNIFIVPDAVINSNNLTTHTAYADSSNDHQFTWYEMNYNTDVNNITVNINKLLAFTGYTCKNNKCYVYPYNYLYVTNNVGNSNIYRYENFYNQNVASFQISTVLSVGCSGKLIPTNYKKIPLNTDESLPLAKYPTCAWSSDAFTNWLTQNAVNISSNLALSLVGAGINTSSATKSSQVASVGLSIAGTIADTIGNFYQAQLLPNIEGGENTGDVTFALQKNTFTFRAMRVKDENIKIIDDYFTRFGYKINRLKVPNLTGRTYWNYVEIGSEEDIGEGDVPGNYMEIINNTCRKGVTIWHSHDNIGNYNLSNTIVS